MVFQPPHVTLKFILSLCLYGSTIVFLFVLLLDDVPASSQLEVLNTLEEEEAVAAGARSKTTTTTTPSWTKEIKPYNQNDVLQTQLSFEYRNMLMIFDSSTGTFHTYGGAYIKHRNLKMNYFLAHALFTNFPVRFQVGAPPLQILYSTEDSPTLRLPITTSITNDNDNDDRDGNSSRNNFAPVLQFGSVPRDASLLDPITTISEMPFTSILPCLVTVALQHDIPGKKCIFKEKTFSTMLDEDPSPSRQWNQLKPQIIWRGTDYPFLERFGLGLVSALNVGIDFKNMEMTVQSVTRLLMEKWDNITPRWKGVALSLQADLDRQEQQSRLGSSDKKTLPWIDVKFFDQAKSKGYDSTFQSFLSAGAQVSTETYMPIQELKAYKYHIDFGGGGGTSWEGTLTKLAMPGVLFHHETIMKDWYYDEIQPWVHYIPVKMDLSDLKEKFEWAEAHPEEAMTISENASNFIREMRSYSYMKDMYWKYFVHHLNNVASAYYENNNDDEEKNVEEEEEEESLQSVLDTYEAKGIKLNKFATCGKGMCVWADGSNWKYNTNLRLSYD